MDSWCALLACYVPKERWVWMQVEFSHVKNETPAALRLVRVLDLLGKIVTGDALLAQRSLRLKLSNAAANLCGGFPTTNPRYSP
jgi:hypothetical protein